MTNPRIPSLLETLLDRLETRESLEIEFKAARGGLPKDIWPTISAFANTFGGWVLLGVRQLRYEFSLEGVEGPDLLVQNLYDQIRNPQKISHPVCGAADVSVEILGDKTVVVVRVPAASRRFRPVYINGNPYAGTYLRRHSGDYHCTKPEVDRMMREASDVGTDSNIIPRYSLDDLEREALARYRRRFQTQHPASRSNSYDDVRFLQSLGGYGRDRETGEEGITVAGLLLLGTPEALREWRGRHLIDFRVTSAGIDSETRWIDRVAWEGNLLGAFEAIYPRLILDQAVPFRLEGSARRDESPVHVVLREALVNLLVHADYAESQASLIVRSPEGYVFRNPGNSRVSEDDLFTGDRSDPRNPRLVRMFRQVGLAEEAGTGIPRILSAWRELGFRLPEIDVGTERYEFSLRLRNAHLLSEDDRKWLRSLGDSWEESEQLALVMARHAGAVDNLSLRRVTGLHPADTTKVLGKLRDRQLLDMLGGGRTARYQLGPAALQPIEEPVNDPSSQGFKASSKDLSSDSKDLPPDSEDLKPALQLQGADPDVAWAELEAMASLAREHPYLDAQTLPAMIVRLCGHAPLSIRQLTVLLGRSTPYLREIVRGLIASGRLVYTYPDRPNHPGQKYVAAPPTNPVGTTGSSVGPRRPKRQVE